MRTAAEPNAVNQASKLFARLVYHVVLREGEEELDRPTVSLIWSGLAEGVLISFSIVAEAIFVARRGAGRGHGQPPAASSAAVTRSKWARSGHSGLR